MKIPILSLAEYATVDNAGKLVIAGTVDGISLRRVGEDSAGPAGPVPIPPLYLVIVLEGSIGDGHRHSLALRSLSDDGHEVAQGGRFPEFQFQVNRYGRPMRAQLVIQLQGLKVPGPGDHEIAVLVVGDEVARTAHYVTDETADSSEEDGLRAKAARGDASCSESDGL